MKILIACEESQRVCEAFRKLGCEAYSCDILECGGDHPEWHIQNNVLPLLNGDISFCTADGVSHKIEGPWDLIIAHPPCTYLTNTGNRWFNEEKYGDKARERKKLREEAANFFLEFTRTNAKHWAIENPVGYMNTHYRKPDQIIQPYEFGDPARKTTCLWLYNLPFLQSTEIVEPKLQYLKSGKTIDLEYSNAPKKDRAKLRSRTYPGIAKAIAEQWFKAL